MKNIHKNAIKYLTYLVLNKKKLDNKQKTVTPPSKRRMNLLTNKAHLPKKA